LGARQRLAARQLTGRLSQARNMPAYAGWLVRRGNAKTLASGVDMDLLQAAAGIGPVEGNDIPPTDLGPASGLGAVLGRNALRLPGDCFSSPTRLRWGRTETKSRLGLHHAARYVNRGGVGLTGRPCIAHMAGPGPCPLERPAKQSAPPSNVAEQVIGLPLGSLPQSIS
jgi:hypothetical protein